MCHIVLFLFLPSLIQASTSLAMSSSLQTVIPPGSLILITGVNGFIGSHAADQTLKAGYNIRGVVRSLQKSSWMLSFFQARYLKTSFDLIEVPDLIADNAFEDAVKGCAGIIHMAAVQDLSRRTVQEGNDLANKQCKVVTNILSAAAKEPSVKSIAYMNSGWGMGFPSSTSRQKLSASSINNIALELAQSDDPSLVDAPNRGVVCFAASKTRAAKACEEWVATHKPHFGVSILFTYLVLGRVLSPEYQGMPSTSAFIKMLYFSQGLDFLLNVPPQTFIDVGDVGRLALAAVIKEGAPPAAVDRLFGWSAKYNWNDILAILRRTYPKQTFPPDYPDLAQDLSEIEQDRSLQLVKSLGRDGWTGLEESVRANVESLLSDNKAREQRPNLSFIS